MKLSTKELILCSIFAAIVAILSQISIPLPFTSIKINTVNFGVVTKDDLRGYREYSKELKKFL